MTMLKLREPDVSLPLRVSPGEVRGAPVAVHGAGRLGWRDLLYPLSPDERRFREQVKEALQDPLFDARLGLNAEAQAKLSYERFRFLRRTLDLRVADVNDNPTRLMTVLDLVGTVDGTLYTVMSIHYCLCVGSILRHGAGVAELVPYRNSASQLVGGSRVTRYRDITLAGIVDVASTARRQAVPRVVRWPLAPARADALRVQQIADVAVDRQTLNDAGAHRFLRRGRRGCRIVPPVDAKFEVPLVPWRCSRMRARARLQRRARR